MLPNLHKLDNVRVGDIISCTHGTSDLYLVTDIVWATKVNPYIDSTIKEIYVLVFDLANGFYDQFENLQVTPISGKKKAFFTIAGEWPGPRYKRISRTKRTNGK